MAFLGDGKQVRVALACLRKRQSGEWLRKRRENRSFEKDDQNRYQMGAGHLPDCSKIMKDRKASKQKNMSASRTAG